MAKSGGGVTHPTIIWVLRKIEMPITTGY